MLCSSAQNFFDGSVDEVRVWSQAHSAFELDAAKFTPLSGSKVGLEAYWRFDEGSDTTTGDSTGHGYSGAISNDVIRAFPRSHYLAVRFS